MRWRCAASRNWMMRAAPAMATRTPPPTAAMNKRDAERHVSLQPEELHLDVVLVLQDEGDQHDQHHQGAGDGGPDHSGAGDLARVRPRRRGRQVLSGPGRQRASCHPRALVRRSRARAPGPSQRRRPGSPGCSRHRRIRLRRRFRAAAGPSPDCWDRIPGVSGSWRPYLSRVVPPGGTSGSAPEGAVRGRAPGHPVPPFPSIVSLLMMARTTTSAAAVRAAVAARMVQAVWISQGCCPSLSLKNARALPVHFGNRTSAVLNPGRS